MVAQGSPPSKVGINHHEIVIDAPGSHADIRSRKMRLAAFVSVAILSVAAVMVLANQSSSNIEGLSTNFDWTANIFHDLPTKKHEAFYWHKLKARSALGDAIEGVAGLSHTVQKMNDDVEDSAEAIDKVAQTAKNLDGRVASNTKNIGTVNSRISDTNRRVSRTRGRVNKLSSRVNSNTRTINKAVRDLNGHRSAVMRAQRRAIARIKAMAARLEKHAGRFNRRISAESKARARGDAKLKRRIAAVDKSITAAHGRISTVDAKVERDNKQLGRLQTTVANNARGFNKRLSGVEKSTAAAHARIQAINKDVSRLTGRLNSQGKRITAVDTADQKRDSRLSRRVSGLTRRLAANARRDRSNYKGLQGRLNRESMRIDKDNTKLRRSVRSNTRRISSLRRSDKKLTRRMAKDEQTKLRLRRALDRQRARVTKLQRDLTKRLKGHSLHLNKRINKVTKGLQGRINKLKTEQKKLRAMESKFIGMYSNLRTRVGRAQSVATIANHRINRINAKIKKVRAAAGPRGRSGPPGPRGPRGRTGPRGFNGRHGRTSTRVIRRHRTIRSTRNVHVRRRRRPVATCATRTTRSNHAGVIRTGPRRGFVTVGGGMINRYPHFNKLAVFEESMPEGGHWRCDTGAGPGHLTCYNRACRFNRPVKCRNAVKGFKGSGVATAVCPRGYVATSGGLYNKWRHYKNNNSGFEGWWFSGSNKVSCDMGFGAGNFNCYARCCKMPRQVRCTTVSRRYRNSRGATLRCPRGYTVTGGGVVNHKRRGVGASNVFKYAFPNGSSAYSCKVGLGRGDFTCQARCCRF